ncbi:MAG: signal recognition particle-docking protein FtsY [Planctomycetales bacterium]|nr:signal recognition particle-docking protein FtsY [Planctomycetales bacterium]
MFERLRAGLAKTRAALAGGLRSLFARPLDPSVLQDLEALLLGADFGPAVAARLLSAIEADRKAGLVPPADAGAALARLRAHVGEGLGRGDPAVRLAPAPPTVVLVCGVNGVGKTTSIAKLAWHLREERGLSVLLAACDTFRAAAVEQLEVWARRLRVEIVRQPTGADAGAVAYDAAEAALARKTDVLVVDTAGRLHTREPLMAELGKIRRVLSRKIPGSPHETLLVLDATVGQNGLAQARVFREAVEVTGIFLAKLDGTAKGGIVLAIQDALGIPVKFVGTGETPEDIAPFDRERYLDGLFGGG